MLMPEWEYLPPVEQTAPVIALTGMNGLLWAGGLGGIARLTDTQWQSQSAGLPLSSVAALASVEGWLFAGGAGGIALSRDGGETWQKADVHAQTGGITAIAVSPQFSSDGAALAATLDAGILRTTDGGAEWDSATFGLNAPDVIGLVWLPSSGNQIIFAATSDGVYRSENAGRSWQICIGTSGAPIAALTHLSDGMILAAVELGGILCSPDAGLTWTRYGDLPPDVALTTLLATDLGVFAGSITHGLLHSTDGGQRWQKVADDIVLAFTVVNQVLYAGTENGLLCSADGQNWIAFPTPPLHDLKRLGFIDDAPLVYGTHATPVLYRDIWHELTTAPLPLTAFVSSPDGVLLASGPAGLIRSADGGDSWQMALAGAEGCVGWLTLQANGVGYAASENGQSLFRTRDGGLSWERLAAPFGILPLVALRGVEKGFGEPGIVLAATYDPRQRTTQLWRSDDEGDRWQPGAELQTDWPFVSVLDRPLALTLGGYIFWEKLEGGWQAERVADGSGIRRLTGNDALLFVLNGNGLYCSQDGGENWQREERTPPFEQILDLVVHNDTLYVLLAGGQVCRCSLHQKDF